MAQPTTISTIDTNLGDLTFASVNPANLNQFWGDIASQVAQSGIMGEHSSSHGAFTPDPGEGGRQGVGNVTKDNPNFLPDGAEAGTGDVLANGGQGFHGVFQAARLGDPNLPGTPVEETVGPFFPEPNGNVTLVSSTVDVTQLAQAIAGAAPQAAAQTTALPSPEPQPTLELSVPH